MTGPADGTARSGTAAGPGCGPHEITTIGLDDGRRLLQRR